MSNDCHIVYAGARVGQACVRGAGGLRSSGRGRSRPHPGPGAPALLHVDQRCWKTRWLAGSALTCLIGVPGTWWKRWAAMQHWPRRTWAPPRTRRRAQRSRRPRRWRPRRRAGTACRAPEGPPARPMLQRRPARWSRCACRGTRQSWSRGQLRLPCRAEISCRVSVWGRCGRVTLICSARPPSQALGL